MSQSTKAETVFMTRTPVTHDHGCIILSKLTHKGNTMLYICTLTLEDQSSVTWADYADDMNHAEGLAIAWATETHNQQVYSITTI